MSEYDVVVVGACNIDQIVYAPKLPLPGETVHGSKYEVGFGGKGANQCVLATKLGAKTSMIAKVGKEDSGRKYISHLKEMGVNIEHISVTKDACTGVAPIIVADDGNNSIVVVCGANMLLTPSDIDHAKSTICSAKVLLCQLEIQAETTLHALKIAKEAGVLTIFNPAPAVPNLKEEFFEYSDIMCVNETEAFSLTGIKVEDEKSAISAARNVLTRGCRACVVTMGKDGCVVVGRDIDPYHAVGKIVDVVDTTGAGDAFIGALAFFISKFGLENMTEMLAKACTVAAYSVTRRGTQQSYPGRADLPDKLFEGIC